MTSPANFNTCDQIIRFAMQDAGKLGKGEDPSSEDFADNMNRLNQLIVFETTQGLKLWLQQDLSVVLTAGKGGQGNPYTIRTGGDVNTPKPMKVLQGYYLDSSNNRRPIYPLSWDEWLRLSQVTQTGAIAQYFVDKRQSEFDVYFWLVPDATAAAGTAHLLIEGPVTQFTGLTDGMNFPSEWGIGLHWMLAADICTGQPQSVIDRCETKAMLYLKALRDWDVEDVNTQIVPDTQRMEPYTNSFI